MSPDAQTLAENACRSFLKKTPLTEAHWFPDIVFGNFRSICEEQQGVILPDDPLRLSTLRGTGTTEVRLQVAAFISPADHIFLSIAHSEKEGWLEVYLSSRANQAEWLRRLTESLLDSMPA